MKKKVKKVKGEISQAPNLHDSSLLDFGKNNIITYATAVNLDRSVPDMYDGMKPVQRRILWASSQQAKGELIKSARVVGDVLGRFHPHGDSSVYGAIVKMVQSQLSPLIGKGNWGTLIDGPAAYRYTNMKMSEYGLSFFDPNYIHKEVTDFVPNFDNKDVEPVTLPALLPNVILNSSEGIGVGATTNIPAFTLDSVIDVLQALLRGEKLDAKGMAKIMKPALRWGGRRVKSKENFQEWIRLFKEPEASIQFEAELKIDEGRKQIVIDNWPPGLNPEKFVDRVRGVDGVDKVYNSGGTTTFTIQAVKKMSANDFESLVKKIQKLTQKTESFKINVTRRIASINDGVVSFETKFMSLSVGQLILEWLKERLQLEQRSLNFRIKRQKEDIKYTELLIYATTILDVIFKSLRQDDSAKYISKHSKLSVDEANQILELRVRQLSKLDANAMKEKLKGQKDQLKKLEDWLKKPKAKLISDFEALRKLA